MEGERKILFTDFPEDIYSDKRIEEVVRKFGCSLRDPGAVREAKTYIERETAKKWDTLSRSVSAALDVPMVWMTECEMGIGPFAGRAFAYGYSSGVKNLNETLFQSMEHIRIGTEDGVLTLETRNPISEWFSHGRGLSKAAADAYVLKYPDWDERSDPLSRYVDAPSEAEWDERNEFLKSLYESSTHSFDIKLPFPSSGDDFTK